MKKVMAIIIALSLSIGLFVFPAGAVADNLSNPPSIPTEGDTWDGVTVVEPSKFTRKNNILYYEISTCEELAFIAQTGGDWMTYNYLLTNDLLLNNKTITWESDGDLDPNQTLNVWTPIGDSDDKFTGIFDGNGYTISGVYIAKGTAPYYCGLFGYASGTIENITVVNSYINNAYSPNSSSGASVGGIVGIGGTVNNAVFSGIVLGNQSATGGIAGKAYAGINNCKNYGTIIGQSYVGGIAGFIAFDYSKCTLNNCINYGSISAGNSDSGGIAGYLRLSYQSTVENCLNYGDVSGKYSTAGVIGYLDVSDYSTSSYLKRCFNKGTVQGSDSVGGITGYSNYSVESCFNSGSVSGNNYVGGISAKGACSDSGNVGTVSGANYVGGIVGENSYSDIINCYNIGAVIVDDGGIAGGISGNSDHYWGNRSTVKQCYYAKEASHNSSIFAFGNRSDSGLADDETNIAEAKSLIDLKKTGTFVNWDFVSIWTVDEDLNGGFPYIQGMPVDTYIAIETLGIAEDTLVLEIDETYTLRVAMSPTNAEMPELQWTSFDTAVATVDENGVVEAKSMGYTTISVMTEDNQFSDTCRVTVKAKTIEGAVGTEGLTYQLYLSVNGRPYCGYVKGYNGTEKDVIVPAQYNGYTIIGVDSSAFRGNTTIESIELPNTIEDIKFNAFQDCTSLKSVALPSSLLTIRANAFNGCTSLESIDLPDSLTSIPGSQTFMDCTNLEYVKIPDSVTELGSSTFMRCTNLKTVVISNQLATVPSQTFSQCTRLQNVIIPDNIKEIGINAFSGCKGLEKIHIPLSITTIGASAFANCSNLTIYCEAASEQDGWADSWNYSNRPVVYSSNLIMVSVQGTHTNDEKMATLYVGPNSIKWVFVACYDTDARMSCVKCEQFSGKNLTVSVDEDITDCTVKVFFVLSNYSPYTAYIEAE